MAQRIVYSKPIIETTKHMEKKFTTGRKNRIIRKLFESLDYKIIKLDRVMFGPLTKRNLPRGKWKFLDQKELRLLKNFTK